MACAEVQFISIPFLQAKATLGLHCGDGLSDLSLEEIHEKFNEKLVVEDLKENKEGEIEGATTSEENHTLHEVTHRKGKS